MKEKNPKLNLLKYRVGDTVELADGRRGRISRILPHRDYPIKSRIGSYYMSHTKEGEFLVNGSQRGHNIIRVIPRKQEPVEEGQEKEDSVQSENFLVIRLASNDKPYNLSNATVKGAFKSEKAAEEFITSDAKKSFNDYPARSLDPETWGSDHMIVEVKKIVRPIPNITVDCGLKTTKKE